MDNSTQTKVCRVCAKTKPLAEFHRMSSSPDGRQYRCKPCALSAAAKYQAQNRTTRASYLRTYDALNAERIAERRRKYRAANRERIAEYAKAYRLANPEKHYSAVLEWHRRNPEKVAELDGRRRARKRETDVGDIDLTLLWTGRCALCNEPLDPNLRHPDPLSRSVDHIVPLSAGGTHTQANLQWTHLVCNLRKGARAP